MENIDLLTECGYNKPVALVRLEDKPNIIQTISLHKVILASLVELSQFRKGISCLGVSTALKEYPQLLYTFFSVEYKEELSSGVYMKCGYMLCMKRNYLDYTYIIDTVRKLFTVIRYSEAGTNARIMEETTYMYFIDYLDDCERGML